MKALAAFFLLVFLAPISLYAGNISSGGIQVTLQKDGSYSVAWKQTGWELKGRLANSVTTVRTKEGQDRLGQYHELDATYAGGARIAGIRLYEDQPSVLFLDTRVQSGANADAFPTFEQLPPNLARFTYQTTTFAKFAFNKLSTQGPWAFFDPSRNTMVFSPADNFLVASMQQDANGKTVSGIDAAVTTLPAGFTHATLLTFGQGIDKTLNTWGSALLALGNKQPTATDADVILNKFGYWTDNGAVYYYHFVPSLGYEGTLYAVRDEFAKAGIPLGYMQLDSWWYPKAKGNLLAHTEDNGALVYRADPKVFPDGLDAFQQKLALPMATHARWMAQSSPYRKQYTMSRNVVLDPAFWNGTAEYLKSAHVVEYEQDWLDNNARPAINIHESHAFLANMASAMQAKGLGIQYCMALPGYFMASTQFPAVRTIRTSDDHFMPARYDAFLYASELAHAVGLLPWSDVFMSKETSNLVLSTLSAGPVGVGDALGATDVQNVKAVMRADSVILKPDSPAVPIDATYISDARNEQKPMVAMTTTRFNGVAEYYVFSYPRNSEDASVSVPLANLSISTPVYAYDWVTHTGQLIPANGSLLMQFHNAWAYSVLAPVNHAGLALLGDTSKVVPLARKRFTVLAEGSGYKVNVAFAKDEAAVTLTGYAAHAPHIHATQGEAQPAQFDPATHLFTIAIAPAKTSEAILVIRP